MRVDFEVEDRKRAPRESLYSAENCLCRDRQNGPRDINNVNVNLSSLMTQQRPSKIHEESDRPARRSSSPMPKGITTAINSELGSDVRMKRREGRPLCRATESESASGGGRKASQNMEEYG